MKQRSIYQQQSQELIRIFEEAGSSKKVLVVAMDYPRRSTSSRSAMATAIFFADRLV